MSDEKIFAFDVGKASLGICARQGIRILDLKSLIIPAEFALTSDFRERRRTFRTRLAHKKREKWLLETWKKSGLEPLATNDDKMTREFSKKGDQSLYNSALLRVALLQDMPLESWQIFKALWASIQHRGYDPECNWKPKSKKNNIAFDESALSEDEKSAVQKQQEKDEKENREFSTKYTDNLNYAVNSNPAFLFPCYLEASLMGLWSFESPSEFKRAISYNPEKVRAKGRVAPRELVEKEVRALFESAKKQLPQLTSVDTNEFLYGPGKEKYASVEAAFNRHRGTEWDAQGVLSQKVPRFDNKIIGKCQLFPQRNSCNAKEPMNLTFKLLHRLKLYKFTDADGEVRVMTPDELNAVYKQLWPKVETQLAEKKPTKINKTDLKKAIEAHIGEFYNPNMPIEEIKLQSSGRARFSRPALRLMNDILLSGINPPEFDTTPYIQSGVANPITRPELESARARLGQTWEKFHIADKRYELQAMNPQDAQSAIQKIISDCNNPVVRHRLTVFWNELKKMTALHGKPDKVVFEFIRGSEGLNGEKTSREWESTITANEKKNDTIRASLESVGLNTGKNNLLRMKLLEEQQGICPYTFKKEGLCAYTGERLDPANLQSYDIDHIVPVSNQIATDSYYNMVLVKPEANREKGNRTPYEWLHGTDQWEAFVYRITQKDSQYGKRKRILLTQKDTRELIDSYNGLAETAYIARMAQQIVALQFGWGLHTAGDDRKVFVNDGKITAKIRQIYKLNELLLSKDEQEALEKAKDAKEQRTVWKKNRSNKKHHALDAFCISYSQQLKMDRVDDNGRVHWHVPGLEVAKLELIQKLDKLFPMEIRRPKKDLRPAETIYSLKSRVEAGKRKHYMIARPVTSGSLVELLGDSRDRIKKIFDPELRDYLLTKSSEIPDKAEWKQFLSNVTHPLRKSVVRKVKLIEDSFDDIKVKDNEKPSSVGEYRDFGKNKTRGQYKKKKQSHQGQYIEELSNNKYKIHPVYFHVSRTEFKQSLLDQGKKLYQTGQLFYPGCTVRIPRDFNGGKGLVYPQGLYTSSTIKSSGEVKLKSADGQIIMTSVRYLIDVGFSLLEYHNDPMAVSP